MRVFFDALKQAQPQNSSSSTQRTWVYVPYDQLNKDFGPLCREAPHSLGIVLVESPWKAARRPYHKQKLAFILANQRHFAIEQAKRGVEVSYWVAEGSYSEALARAVEQHGPLQLMEPAERELRHDIAPLVRKGSLKLLHHEGWLTRPEDFTASQKKGPPWRMDSFYRHVRKRTGILMDDAGKPVGGKFSYDAENRKFWTGEPEAAVPPRFDPDPITDEVVELIEERYAHHPGTLDPSTLPRTRNHAEEVWAWALRACLPMFGPFEDAMSTASTNIFHTRISALMNVHRLLPARIVQDVVNLDIPLASQEGFLRQVIGWREFMRHVHSATDGFRNLPGQESVPVASAAGDGGYGAWAGKPWRRDHNEDAPDGGSTRSALGSDRPVPPAYWGRPSGLRCLDSVVKDVWDEAYSHHITRLMVLGNLAQLLEVSSRDLTDWFWVAYIDAFDWVVEPNVMGMGTYGLGGLFTTKPYVSGGAYIDKMSDYCGKCALKKVCPVTHLYWAFMTRHRPQLDGNYRLRMIMASENKRSPEKKRVDSKVFDYVSSTLAEGKPVQAERLKQLTRQEQSHKTLS
ncbi:MAG: cryptochrome/photolyase family protein [Myxococcota bacterium]